MRSFPMDAKNFQSSFIAAPVEAKFAPAETGQISGYGSVYGVSDRHGDIVEAGAFDVSLAAHKQAGTRPAMLWSHNIATPIGVWDDIVSDGYGLKMSGHLNLDVPAGRDAYSLLKQRAVDGLSIGYRVFPGGAEIARKTGVRHLRNVDLYEVSLVTVPSNIQARVSGVKSADAITSRPEFEDLLREIGFAKSAARKLAGGWNYLTKDDETQAAAELLSAVRQATMDLKGGMK